jgi:putative flippase GtrA
MLFPRRLRGVSDPLTGFFVVRREAIDLTALQPDGFKILLEILLRTPGLRVGEIGFDFAERHSGTSKASVREAARYARLVTRLRIATAPRRLGAFALVGLTGIVVNEVALATFYALGLGTGLLSLLLATQVSSLWLFVLTDRLVFRDIRPARSTATRLVAFMAVNTSALLIRGPIYLVLHRWLGLHFLVANLISICALTLIRFAIADRVLWRERDERTFHYCVHDLVTIASPVALPELQRFQVEELEAPPRIQIAFGKIPALPCGMGFCKVAGHDRLSYREWAGFSVTYDFDDTTLVTVNPFLGHSPHVLYTNCAEPLLRWKFAELGFALVHAACVAQGDRAYLITARTDTGKTTTILKALDHDASLGFISDDLTLVHPDGRVLSYPKPLTISQHTLHAVKTPNLTRNQRAALVVQARLHSRGGRSIGMALFRMGLPAATMNSVIQWLIPPPKYDVEQLIPTVDVVEQAQLSGMVVIERGGEGSVELEPAVALETLLENCDDAYGFPPYPVIHELLHGRRAVDLQAAERTTVERAISGHTTLLLRSSTMDWWQRLPQIMGGWPIVAAPVAAEPVLGLLDPPRLAMEADAVE